MISFTRTKEEHKRYRGITITDKMQVWGKEGGLTLHIEGKTRMVITLLQHIFNFCKKHQIEYDEPTTKHHNKRVDVWIIFKSAQECQTNDLEYIIKKYNRVRKNKVVYESY